MTTTSNLHGKVALVTGAGSGVGRSVAIAYARAGASVALLGRTGATLDQTAELIHARGGDAIVLPTDVTEEWAVVETIQSITAWRGGLDIAFNCAGVFVLSPIDECTLEDWNKVMTLNVTGVFLGMKHQVRAMRERRGGTIINMSSNLGAHKVAPGMASYIASKAAVSALTRAVAREVIGAGIRVNAISAGPIDNEMSTRPGESAEAKAARMRSIIPLGRAGTEEEITAAVVWLTSPESGYAVGHDLVLDGGESL